MLNPFCLKLKPIKDKKAFILSNSLCNTVLSVVYCFVKDSLGGDLPTFKNACIALAMPSSTCKALNCSGVYEG